MNKLFSYGVMTIFLFIICTMSRVYSQVHNQNTLQEFQDILDNSSLRGSILIYDPELKVYYSNNFSKCREGHLPASTFKIPHALIALETHAIPHDSFLIRWDGQKRSFPQWERDLTFKEAFRVSCVPCFQQIAQKIGLEKMNLYLSGLGYGKMSPDAEHLQEFWLRGSSRIDCFEQIDFLQRFYQNELPVSPATIDIVKNMMYSGHKGSYNVYGKTGWSVQNGVDNGWYVGYIQNQEKIFYFAANIEPLVKGPSDSFITLRKEVVFRAFDILNIHE